MGESDGFHLVTRHFQVPPYLKNDPRHFKDPVTGLDYLLGSKPDSYVVGIGGLCPISNTASPNVARTPFLLEGRQSCCTSC